MNDQNDLSDVDPQVVNAVLANADAYLEAQRRIELILKKADSELEKVERNIAREEPDIDGDSLTAKYKNALDEISQRVHASLKELESEFQQRYPA